jgi:transporter family-2 protein
MTKSMIAFAVVASIVGGMLTAAQGPTNAMLARPLNSPVNAAFVSFFIGTVVLLGLIFVLRIKPDL